MKTSLCVVAGAVGVALVLAVACGPETKEKPEQVEHRIGPCTTWCAGLYDPECGRENPTANDHKTEMECAEHCADPENAAYNWARNDDGVDVCKDEWMALVECLPTMTCDEKNRYWSDPPQDSPCSDASRAQSLCFSRWAVEAGEG